MLLNGHSYKLSSRDPLSRLVVSKGILNYLDLLKYLKSLPYGRSTNRGDHSQVLTEGKGTCSNKHALAKEIAIKNSIPNVTLWLCIYRMNNENTSGIGQILTKNKLKFIPEAHCYITLNQNPIDLTFENSDVKKLEKDILYTQEIQPKDVIEEKILIHQSYLKNWIIDENISKTFEEIWSIREECILKLSKPNL